MAVNWQRRLMRVLGAGEQPVTVTAVEDVLPWYRRVHFSAPEFLSGLDLFPTLWVRLWVPSLDDPGLLKQRGYTLVDPDPDAGTFAMEFVLHEPTGPGASWAQEARPGDAAEIAFTPAKLVPDASLDTFLLVGDASAIPAINSLLAHLPADASAHVVVLDRHDDVEQLIRSGPSTRVSVVGDLAGQLDAVRSFALGDTGYAWAAGERKAVAAVREVFRREWHLPKERQHTQYYWIEGKSFV